jgi:glycerophosphoryl diester phosphodiesterase
VAAHRGLGFVGAPDYTEAPLADTMGTTGIGELVWPVVVAHRGASKVLPENTIAAFEAAVEFGADVVELDVRLTADDQLAVVHDPYILTADGRHEPVHSLTLERVRRLDEARGREERTRIPTLDEALDALSGRAGVDIEIKNLPGEPAYERGRQRIAERVVKLLDEMPFEDPVLISSFNPEAIGRVRELSSGVATGFLFTAALDPRSALALAVGQGHAFVLPQAEAVEAAGEGFVRECRAAGRRIGAWTVDAPARIARLFSLGVDAVATNDPQAAVPIRDAARAGRQP